MQNEHSVTIQTVGSVFVLFCELHVLHNT